MKSKKKDLVKQAVTVEKQLFETEGCRCKSNCLRRQAADVKATV